MGPSSTFASPEEYYEEKPRKGRRRSEDDAFAIFYFLWIGGCTNTVWNAVMNSFDYFKLKFTNSDEIEFIFPLPQHVASLLVTFIITQLSNVLSYSTRIVSSIIIITVITVILPIQADVFQNSDFGLTLIMITLFFLGFFNNMAYASIAGFTSQIDGKYTAYFLIGVAIAGLVVNGLRWVIIKIFDYTVGGISDDNLFGVQIYFMTVVALLVTGLVLHFMFMRSDFYHCKIKKRIYSVLEEDGDGGLALLSPSHNTSNPKRNFGTLMVVAKETWFYLLLILVSCVQQHFSYPGLALAKPIPGMENHTKTVSMIAVFSAFYIIGKKMGQYREYYNRNTMTVLTLFRFVIIAFFILQVVAPEIPILNTAAFGYLNVVLFALTMGVINVGLFILTPEQVTEDKKEIAGFIAVFAINLGTIIGAFSIVPLKEILHINSHGGGH